MGGDQVRETFPEKRTAAIDQEMARKENLEVTIESNRAPISASLALPWLDELAVALVIGHGCLS